MFTTVPELFSRAGNSAWVIAMWPNRLTSNCRRHCGDRQCFDRRVDRDPGIVDQRAQGTTQRVAGDPVGDRGDVRFHGDVEDARLDARDAQASQRVGVDLAAYTGQYMKSPARQFVHGGRARYPWMPR